MISFHLGEAEVVPSPDPFDAVATWCLPPRLKTRVWRLWRQTTTPKNRQDLFVVVDKIEKITNKHISRQLKQLHLEIGRQAAQASNDCSSRTGMLRPKVGAVFRE